MEGIAACLPIGERDVAEISDTGAVLRARHTEAAATTRAHRTIGAVRDVPIDDWLMLSASATEPNGYYLPEWEIAVDASARSRGDAAALCARNEAGLIALLPVVSAWRAFKLPLPVLVSADAYGDLGTPPIDRRAPLQAARTLLAQARRAGAHALVLRHVTLEGMAMKVLTAALREDGLAPHVLRSESRACLDATADAGTLLREALGTKKLKELRRQRNRLADYGAVSFTVATTPTDVPRALETFLKLEASGWKASRGTALAQDVGDAAFIRRAVAALAARRQCEIVTLAAGETPVAAGIVLRHQDRAFWFKVGLDERFAKYSPGVQLALEITRHFCADPQIALVDSTAAPGHPMIEPIWRSRLPIGDVVIPLLRNDPIVTLAIASLRIRSGIRSNMRGLIRFLRSSKEKRS